MFSQKKMMPLDQIDLDPDNVRRHNEKNIKAIMKSLERSYQRKPIVLYGNKVIAGNGTVEAARRLGWKEIWVNDDPFESEEDARAYALADNRTNDLSDFDNEKLIQTLEQMEDSGWDIDALGWDNVDLDLLKENEFNPDIDDKKEIEQKHRVIVELEDVSEMEELFNELKERGFKVKI